jgi:hypothetical protein
LHAKNELSMLSGSALQVCLVVEWWDGVGGWFHSQMCWHQVNFGLKFGCANMILFPFVFLT